MAKLERRSALETSNATDDREADHRIGNSLAFLSATLRFEGRRITSVEAARVALSSAANRLTAISRVHFLLSRTGRAGTVHLPTYLSDLGGDISESLDIDIRVNSQDVTVRSEVAGCIAVVINELATNSFKHSGVDGRTAIVVSALTDNGSLVVIFRDNGNGFPDGFDIEETTGLGMTIITSAVLRHNGSVQVVEGPGAACRIEFPI